MSLSSSSSLSSSDDVDGGRKDFGAVLVVAVTGAGVESAEWKDWGESSGKSCVTVGGGVTGGDFFFDSSFLDSANSRAFTALSEVQTAA